MFALRRSLRHVPQYTRTLPIPVHAMRRMTIQAGAPPIPDDPSSSASASSSSSSSSTNFELVSGSSQHPFASIVDTPASSSASADSADGSSSNRTDPLPDSTDVVTNLPQPPPSPPPAIPYYQHPFDTHAFVTYLEKSEVEKGTAVVLMESVRELIIWRKTRALERLLDKEDQENVRVPLTLFVVRGGEDVAMLTAGGIPVPRGAERAAGGAERAGQERFAEPQAGDAGDQAGD